MKEWFLGLQGRERIMVAGAAVLIGILVLWQGIWAPLAGRLDRLEQGLTLQQENLAWMQSAAMRVEQLRRQGGGAGKGLGGRSLLAVVDQAAGQAGLSGGLQRIEPEGRDQVRVRFENVVFDSLIKWLGRLERGFGIRVSAISIERGDAPGRVSVRLTLDAVA